MAYQSLYRRYRPRRFAEVRGQDHLVRALQNAVRDGRVGHAYLFSGPRGTGKTSTARILAKVLNCEAPADGEPCGECPSCLAIDAGTSFDVHELDAASNNGVEAVRDLIAKASLGTPGRTKVYILDEVHMLSTAASNALLKTLEEPPDHVVFVLATTDPQKVLPTIRSRTQHFEVHLLPAAELEALVDHVITDAGLDVAPDARDYVLRAGAGSARDTLSALDQVVAAGGVLEDTSALDELVEALCDRDTARALVAVERAVGSGRSLRLLGEQLIGRLRDVFLAALGTDLPRLADREREVVAGQAERLGRPAPPGPSRCWGTRSWASRTCPTPASPWRWRWSGSRAPTPTPVRPRSPSGSPGSSRRSPAACRRPLRPRPPRRPRPLPPPPVVPPPRAPGAEPDHPHPAPVAAGPPTRPAACWPAGRARRRAGQRRTRVVAPPSARSRR
ncbi:MAG: DNA polymerase III subunit gamma/tau [Acidimicrobiales bacterium]